jgi:predicted RNA-binding protein with PUA-like domain
MSKKKTATRARHTWLLKSEPAEFSFADLWQAKNRTTSWGGVRNYQARNLLRDELTIGDRVLFYHSNADPSGIAGIGRVVRAGYPDPTQFERGHAYHDPASRPEAPRWFAVDVRAERALPSILALEALRREPLLEGMVLLRKGSRLSVQPVSPVEWRVIRERAGFDPEDES